MKMTDNDKLPDHDDAALDALFAAARDDTPVPSAALLARITADAEREVAMPATIARAAPKRRGLAWLVAALGGWPAVSGLATATVAGLWLGYTEPGSLTDFTGTLWPAAESGYGLGDLVPSYDLILDGDDA